MADVYKGGIKYDINLHFDAIVVFKIDPQIENYKKEVEKDYLKFEFVKECVKIEKN